MNYEIERKLNEKVDKWEFHSLQTENDRQKNEIHQLERKVQGLENEISNKHYTIVNLVRLLAEQPELREISNELYQIANNLTP